MRKEKEDLIAVVHRGSYPLYNLSLMIQDLNNKDHDDIMKRPRVNIGDLGTGLVKVVKEFKITERDDNYLKFQIYFYCLKGHFLQDLRLIKFENKWYSALRILEGDKTVFSKMTDDYPIKDPFK